MSIMRLLGKLFADKNYFSKELFTKLWRGGLHLITGIRKTMKNYLMPWFDKVILRKRFIIETLFDKLKSAMSLEHWCSTSQSQSQASHTLCRSHWQVRQN